MTESYTDQGRILKTLEDGRKLFALVDFELCEIRPISIDTGELELAGIPVRSDTTIRATLSPAVEGEVSIQPRDFVLVSDTPQAG